MLKIPKHSRGMLALLAAALLTVAAQSTASPANAAGTDHFVDCSAGTNGAGTQADPWNSLAPVNSMQFGPGDCVLFKVGTTCVGQLTPSGSGANASAAHSGSFGLTTGAANSGVQQTISGLQPGTTYVLTGWLHAVSGEQIALGVKSFGAAESFHQVAGATYAPAAVVFTTGTTSTQATVYCYKNTGSAAGACDDLAVTAVG